MDTVEWYRKIKSKYITNKNHIILQKYNNKKLKLLFLL